MGLEFNDLVALSHGDEKTGTLPMTSREVFRDPASRERLIDQKMVEPGGKITMAGLEVLQKIRKREEELREGIPIAERKDKNPHRLCKETTEPWFFIMLGKNQVVLNGELLFIGPQVPAMKATRAGEELKKQIPDVIRRCAAKVGLSELWPHSYQAFSLGGVDLIWLADDKQDLMIPIQTKYFDFIKDRFQAGTFWGISAESPIQVKVRGKGVESVVAIVAPFDVCGRLNVPKKRERWRDGGKEMSDTGMSVMEDGA